MKKIILALLIISPMLTFGQSKKDTTYWNKGGGVGLTFNQASLTNWAAGGVSSISGGAYLNYFFDYKKENMTWENTLDLGYGMIREEGEDVQKSDDKIIFISKFGHKVGKSDEFFYSALVDFRTQFAPGFTTEDPREEISRFLAPGYLIISLGIDYKPNEFFSASFGPLSSKMTFVNDQRLADLGSFGVDAAEVDANGNVIQGTGKNFRGEFGGTFSAHFNKEIIKNVTYTSNLLLFSNYVENPDKIDVNWENTISMKINSVLSARFYLQTLYDYDIKFEEYDEAGTLISSEDRWQWKSILSIGLAYNFGGTRG